MTIKSIYIDNFGMFSDFTISLSDGLNIIEGKNETGKSTLGMFIKFIFYGLDTKERAKYVSWGKNSAGGHIVLEDGGKTYAVRRELLLLQKGVKDEVFITDTETNTIVFKDRQPWEVFLGVNDRVFANTVYVGQINGSFVDGEKLTDAVENILFSADEMTNTSKALKRLDELRTSLLYKNKKGGKIYELGGKIADLELREAKSREANERLFDLEDKIRQSKQKKEENAKTMADILAKTEEYEAYSAIERKQRCDEVTRQAMDCKKAYEALRDQLSSNGFIPDNEYAAKLYTLQNDINRQQQELLYAESELSNAENDLAVFTSQAEVIDNINAAGGRTEVERTVNEFKSKYKRLRILGFIFLIAVIGIFFLISASKTKKKLKEYLSTFGCESAEELENILSDINEQEQQITVRRVKIESAAARCAAARQAVLQTQKSIKEETEKYIPVIQITESSVAEAAKKAEQAISEIAKAKGEFETKYYAAQALIKETANINEEEMRSRIKGKLKASEIEAFDCNEQKRRLAFLQKATESLNEKILSLEKEFSALCATVEDPAAIADELFFLRTRYAECVAEYKACVLAYETLENASRSLREGIAPKLSKLSGGFMEKLSNGKYSAIGIDENYGVFFTENATSRPVSSFSSGTGDLAYICLRFALTDILYRKGKPPMIFDDTFAHIDDDRLKNLIAVLSAMGKSKWLQPIVLTCHTRERSIAMSFPETNIIRMEK